MKVEQYDLPAEINFDAILAAAKIQNVGQPGSVVSIQIGDAECHGYQNPGQDVKMDVALQLVTLLGAYGVMVTGNSASKKSV